MIFGDTDFPFGLCDLAELKGINASVSPHELLNNNIVNDKNDNYNYSISEYYNSIDSNNFNIFHNNVNGLESKFENFHHFLTNVPIKFDIIAVTETTQRIMNEFHTNIKSEGNTNFYTATNKTKAVQSFTQKTHLMLQKGLISI